MVEYLKALTVLNAERNAAIKSWLERASALLNEGVGAVLLRGRRSCNPAGQENRRPVSLAIKNCFRISARPAVGKSFQCALKEAEVEGVPNNSRFDTIDIQRIGDVVDGYWNLWLNLRYDHPGNGFYANLNASNLLDEEIRYPANEVADFTRGLIGPGRVVTATVGWKF